MKTGVLFWGFIDTLFICDLVKDLSKNNLIKDIFIQIQIEEKTINLVDVNPKEIIRVDYTDIKYLKDWLMKYESEKILAVLDIWSLVHTQDSKSILYSILDLVKLENVKFLFLSPKVYNVYNFDFLSNKGLLQIASKVSNFLNDIKLFHEIAINAHSEIFILCTPPTEQMFNLLTESHIFSAKKFLFMNIIPFIFKKYPSEFLSRISLLDNLKSEIYKLVLEIEKGRKFTAFRRLVKPDLKNPFYKIKKNNKDLSLKFYYSISLERFFNEEKIKNNNAYILWLIYNGINESFVNNVGVKNLNPTVFSEIREK